MLVCKVLGRQRPRRIGVGLIFVHVGTPFAGNDVEVVRSMAFIVIARPNLGWDEFGKSIGILCLDMTGTEKHEYPC